VRRRWRLASVVEPKFHYRARRFRADNGSRLRAGLLSVRISNVADRSGCGACVRQRRSRQGLIMRHGLWLRSSAGCRLEDRPSASAPYNPPAEYATFVSGGGWPSAVRKPTPVGRVGVLRGTVLPLLTARLARKETHRQCKHRHPRRATCLNRGTWGRRPGLRKGWHLPCNKICQDSGIKLRASGPGT
jgi:hypothetical protein